METWPRLLLALAAGLASGPGCNRSGSNSPEPAPTPFDALPYRAGAPPPGTKFFLVAGGSDIANFAGEVVAQRELWMNQGFEEREIACYYAKPTPKAYKKDREQYDSLHDELRDCFAAKPAVVNAHLAAAHRADLPFLYLYVTGHGLGSVGRSMRRSKKLKDLVATLTAEERTFLNRPAVGLEADGGPGLEQPETMVAAHRSGQALQEIMFTTDVLASALESLPTETRKFVVLQACYSGAFLPRDGHPNRLADVPNLTVLTATRRDRPSFGCGSADVATYFGGVFTRVLERSLEEGDSPPDVPWDAVYEDTAFMVETWERVEGETPSKPQILRTDP